MLLSHNCCAAWGEISIFEEKLSFVKRRKTVFRWLVVFNTRVFAARNCILLDYLRQFFPQCITIEKVTLLPFAANQMHILCCLFEP